MKRVIAGAMPSVLGIAILLGASALPSVRFFNRNGSADVATYQRYAGEMRAGKLPYRDFFMEYPPGAIPVFLLPDAGNPPARDYVRYFKLLVLALSGVAITAMAFLLQGLGASRPRLYGAVAFAAVAPALLGQTWFQRYDVWPAALSVLGLALVIRRHERVGAAALALGAAAKAYPAVLAPLALAYIWKREGRRRALTAAGVFVAIVAVLMLPFAALAPGGLGWSFYVQSTRHPELESLGASILLAAHRVGVYEPKVVSGLSANLAGSLPAALAAVQVVIQLALLIAIWIWFARSRGRDEQLIVASAAALATFVAFGKVLSPQFLIWLVPVVPLVAGRLGVAACALLAGALALTQAWFPRRFHDVLHLGRSDWLILPRDLLLVTLGVLLTLAVRAAAIRAGPS